MDYEVFLLSRIREEGLQPKDNRAAVASGLEKTAGVITSAACLFVIVTGAFAFASLVTTKEIGVGMTVAVLATQPSYDCCWCRPRCACWVAGTGGCRAGLCLPGEAAA